MLQKILCLILFSLPCLVTKAQNQTAQWYFGNQAHLDFQANPPILSQAGSMYVLEGSSTISDNKGNLLFYTNGRTVWNKNHLIMSNGDSLTISTTNSVTQPAVIIPFPNDSTQYYIFSIDYSGNMYYAIVDMTLEANSGSVTLKRQLLLNNVEEKMTAVHHCDGKSVWISVHKRLSNQFYSYLVTSLGIENPVISASGINHTSQNNFGGMVFSPDGTKIALVSALLPILEILDFDNNQGTFSNLILDSLDIINGAYGISFSADSRLLYMACIDYYATTYHSKVLQYNTNLADSQSILNSQTVIYLHNPYVGAALSLAKDGKIYISYFDSAGFIDVINSPNSTGLNCNYEHGYYSTNTLPNYINASGNLQGNTIGLPNFIQSYFCPLGPAYNNIIIEKDTALPCNSTYTLHTQGDWLSRQWSTGDTSESISVSQSGYYSITCVRKNGCVKTDTVHILIGETNANVTREGANLIAATNATYQWIDCNGNTPILGGTNQVFTPTVNGNYAVIVSDGLCVDTSACYPMLNVGIAASQGQKGLEVYPNPAQDEISFVWHKALENDCELHIYNSLGNLVIQKTILYGTENYILTVENMTNGIYFYQISDGNSGKFSVVK